jgi:hypothetical protein
MEGQKGILAVALDGELRPIVLYENVAGDKSWLG